MSVRLPGCGCCPAFPEMSDVRDDRLGSGMRLGEVNPAATDEKPKPVHVIFFEKVHGTA